MLIDEFQKSLMEIHGKLTSVPQNETLTLMTEGYRKCADTEELKSLRSNDSVPFVRRLRHPSRLCRPRRTWLGKVRGKTRIGPS
jgi:hypothetical protein